MTTSNCIRDKAGHKMRARLAQALGVPVDTLTGEALRSAFDAAAGLVERSPLRKMLLQCAAHCRLETGKDGRPLDPVARFHPGNGARIERPDWMADGSAKGIMQSYGLMVNYLRDFKRLGKYRSQMAQGTIATSSAFDALVF